MYVHDHSAICKLRPNMYIGATVLLLNAGTLTLQSIKYLNQGWELTIFFSLN